MTNDSKLFPPRTRWEEQGYRPDEYSRWLKGDWRPITELWSKLGIDPSRVTPVGIELEGWLLEFSALPDQRKVEAQLVYGHLLKPGDVAKTDASLRCAQPPYYKLPIPRADIPAGIFLSREADAWIQEDRVEDMALPLYEGRMVDIFDFSQKGWESGRGRGAKWPELPISNKYISPQYLMGRETYRSSDLSRGLKLGFLAIGSATNRRSMYVAVLPDLPCGNSVATLRPSTASSSLISLVACLSAFTFDYIVRLRLTGINLNYFVIREAAVPRVSCLNASLSAAISLSMQSQIFADQWIRHSSPCNDSERKAWKGYWSMSVASRTCRRVVLDALAGSELNLTVDDMKFLLRGCDLPKGSSSSLDPKGFWRVDKDKDPELRHTVLTLIAFHDLEEKIREQGGNREAGIEAFLTQNNGEGWLLPENVRLADYGLGHDERALEHQPVASRLGPRFYDWQLAQSAEESWRECHLHARNQLGEAGYQNLLAEIEAERSGQTVAAPPPLAEEVRLSDDQQMQLFS